MIAPIPVRVECHAGYRAEEYPTAVYVASERLEVAEALDRWYEGGLDPTRANAEYHKVRTADGSTLILKHEPASHAWYLMSEQ